MKTNSSKILIISSILFCFSLPLYCAEIVDDETVQPDTKNTVAPIKTAAAAVSAKPTHTAKDASTASALDAINEIKSRLDDLSKSVKELKDDIRTIEEKNTEAANTASALETYKKQLDDLDGKYGEDRKKTAALESKFQEIKDTLKDRVDKMQGWDDIMDVFKKEIGNNESEIARLRREIDELKKQYGRQDDMFSAIAQWPYAGITALVISLAAFITVMVKH